jgi:putative DNA-invertase from lambdoid prophage Rac
MRVATYHRVSTIGQNEELARGELRAAALARGGEVVLDVEETGSGGKNDRPGLQKVMAAAARGQLDAVIVWKLDRFGRSALDLLNNIESLNKCGVRFIAVTQGLDVGAGGDAISKLILTVLVGVAEFERELIRERTRLGLKEKMAQIEGAGGFFGKKSKVWRTRLGRPSVDVDVVAQIRAGYEAQVLELGTGNRDRLSPYLVAKDLDVAESTVRTYFKRWRQTGSGGGFNPFPRSAKKGTFGRGVSKGGKPPESSEGK